jgi:hypothetical protein
MYVYPAFFARRGQRQRVERSRSALGHAEIAHDVAQHGRVQH